MSGILDLLNSNLGKTIISGVSNQTNQPQNKTQDVLTMALPVLMTAMKRNASTTQGAEGLLSALGSKHDGSILENLEGLFEGGVDSNVLDDGGKILGHVLGEKQQHVQMALSQKSGIDAESVSQILKVAAPILMGLLGNQAKKQNVNSANGIEGLLGNLLGGSSAKNEQSFLESMLDADGDGSVIDDVAGMVLGGSKKKGGLGGLLGGLFGGK
ncbi:MAG: DUF937 domain-containing protein [Flavobacteriales bacterium]|nr:DUF937 domain-containing protein [Flavobacteriia bacterium]NCP06387.1 DUF937 domain-containing protein [Flavobacteriales bacterium]PIV94695.1 MAG: hypothetical protein COW44_03015 [Flavobacteriaceae bacterium CG17_big_fil_post_rev_8_21_14_2_50_33_15]PIY10867.1 MAG: hypothetical protein COZ17_08490 [Flavobacteriaceae bacterium CG_4_10_14_3_um_filter_33_47]PJB20568.1 MAG: hypothetical protein CO117_00590 [Flavobacteriaceae bacterium CG_4_9_14_3_um_filter_33_16]